MRLTVCWFGLAAVMLSIASAETADEIMERGISSFQRGVVSTSYSEVSGKRIAFEIMRDDLKRSPDWSPESKQPPPLTPQEAVTAARQEVARHVDALAGWVPTEITLQILEGRWIYIVALEKAGTGCIRVPVTLDGTAIRGKIVDG